MKKKVMVAMSGGVDSSVASLLLKQAGFEVVGVTMCLGVKAGDSDKPRCCGLEAIEDAKRVCDKLGIPHYVMDFSEDLEEKVIDKFISEYIKGRTPNPCIECNRFLKFDVLLRKALSLGFNYLATGHYAGIEQNNGSFILKKARDKNKDQSYFLYPIKKERLKSILFPLFRFTKAQVRRIAQKAGLAVAAKPESQDICFVAKKDYRKFIEARIKKIKPGPILDLKKRVLGRHKGICFYTIGQREGLGISWRKPLYVISIDVTKNQIIVGERESLKAKSLVAGNLNFLIDELPEENIFAKIRYGHKPARCKIKLSGNKLKVDFIRGQEAITPGQSVVLYHRDTVLGGGVIEEVVGYEDSRRYH